MKKHIANIVTGSRIVLSLPLLFIPLTSSWFCVIYLLCGLSDMIDGTVATVAAIHEVYFTYSEKKHDT